MVSKIDLNISRNIVIRSISAIFLIPLVVYIILDEIGMFYAIIGLVAVFMGIEWYRMIKSLNRKLIWSLFALIYVASFVASFLWIRYQENGQVLLLWLVITTWMADIGAFIFGKIIGGPKLVPKISPQKTWAGFVGAIIFAGLNGITFSKYFSIRSGYIFVGITMAFGILAQLGDLSESWIKRKANIKNSGKMIPGHGGILDRVDSLMGCSIALVILMIFFKKYLF